jgi:hypothetical protein
MKAFGPFRLLSRWNRRAVAVFAVLLLCTWLGFFVMGMFPLHQFNFILYQVVLAMACGLVLFLVWLTILISPGIRQQEKPFREVAWRLATSAACLLLGVTAVCAGGGPHRLGTRIGGKWGVALGPIRELQHSPALVALAQGTEIAHLPRDQWPESVFRTGPWPFDRRVPQGIMVHPSPPGSPSFKLYFGRGSPSVIVQSPAPRELEEPSDYDVVQWADDVWLCRNFAD